MFQKPLPILFITGISSGIGYFLAKSLSLEYNIIGTVRRESDRIRLNEEFSDIKIYIMDLNIPISINEVFLKIEQDYPLLSIYALINNAGTAISGAIIDLPMDQFEEQIRINLISQVQIIQSVFPYLEKGKSRIINMSSVSGLFASPFVGAYVASKFGLEGLSDSLRRELSLLDIKVILVEPGPLKTNIWMKNLGLHGKYPNSLFSAFLVKTDQMILDIESKALPVEYILRPIMHSLKHKHPKNRYLVHSKPTIIRLISNFIPSKWVDALVIKSLKSINK